MEDILQGQLVDQDIHDILRILMVDRSHQAQIIFLHTDTTHLPIMVTKWDRRMAMDMADDLLIRYAIDFSDYLKYDFI